MKFSDVSVVFIKEVLEVLRDKRTLAIMFVLPALYGPLVSLLPALLLNEVSQQAQTKVTKVVLLGDAAPAAAYFQSDKKIKLVQDVQLETLVSDIMRGKCDVAVDFSSSFAHDLERGAPVTVTLIDNAMSGYEFDESNVTKALDAFADDERERRLQKYNLPTTSLKTLSFKVETVETSQQRSAYWVGVACALLLVLSMGMASMYPALDLITGERERGTLVLLLMAASDRRGMVLAKLLTVACMGLVSAWLSLISICVGLKMFVRTTNDMSGAFTLSLPLGDLLLSSLFLIPLALAVAACSVLIASYARTFQQGQSYFLPLILAGVVLSGLALACDETAPFFVNFVPMVNLLLCMHQGIQGHWNLLAIAVTMASSAVYVAVLMNLAINILDNEETLFGIKSGSRTKSVFVKEAVLLFAISIASFFYLMPMLQSMHPLWGLVMAQFCTIALPAVLAPRMCHLPFVDTMRLKMPSLYSLAGALFLCPALVFTSTVISQMQSGLFPNAEQYMRALQEALLPRGVDLPSAYIAIALTPAVCEELLFRGAIQGLLRKRLRGPMLCVIVGIMFGIMHTSSVRFLPTAALGAMLAAVAEITGSIIPCMLLHALNNGLAIYLDGKDLQPSASNIIAVLASTAVAVALLAKARNAQSQKDKAQYDRGENQSPKAQSIRPSED